MKALRKDLICPCCKGSGVQDKHACQAYKQPLWNGKTFQCNLEGRYDLNGVHYCGSHLKQELRNQNRLDEYATLTAKKQKPLTEFQQFMKAQNEQG
jgi:pyruvate formate-lyase activating enzyme-like uncharacterized protein